MCHSGNTGPRQSDWHQTGEKAITKGQVDKVYIARDAESHIIEPIRELCSQKNISVVMVDTMESLGRACGIEW